MVRFKTFIYFYRSYRNDSRLGIWDSLFGAYYWSRVSVREGLVPADTFLYCKK